jgi:uncharacterized protein
MVLVGNYNTLIIDRKVDFGFYLDDGADGILLPTRFAPPGAKKGDAVKVFVYHDSDNRLIATTETPKAIAGDIAMLTCVSTRDYGAFLDWGLMKDLFVARSQQLSEMKPGNQYLVKLYVDEQTGRIAATEKIAFQLSNDDLSVEEMEMVELVVYRKSDLGYVMIINNKHTGLLHNNQVFTALKVGDKLQGFIKHIRPDNKIDVVLGKPGYQKVEDETGKILRLLKEAKGFLPYNDKSSPDDIYAVFGMSKKVFKMTTGALYKQRKINFKEDGIELL